ncbi:glycoprotein-N-acetylgalactosamine 3-beta-galactosyltransferase [Paragonimus westermani]|uniref:N-acetylgalactosaminide beta-1,3-galactosyltransferase n=1 Tax=Paragonimus westermani TaxID=34504 RepID=A0A5J4NS16_9TREM|nr:glycoprotein-N-acetylgalactosamine 3-beta-galactosyltransferase [Paragonimus westermani]
MCHTVIDWSKQTKIKNHLRLLCYINTVPRTKLTKAIHVKHTWARHCTKYLFMSSEEDPFLPAVNLNLTVPEARKHLWSKMRKILNYVYKFRNQYDFFLKADDDTYIIPENLRAALLDFNSNEPILLGYPFTHVISEGHVSGGAGYVFSRATLKLLVTKAIDRHPACPTYDEDKEDVKISQCAYAVGVAYKSLVDRHTTYPYSWRSDPRNENLFQWRSLEHLFEKMKKHAYRPAQFDAKDPFLRNETVSDLFQCFFTLGLVLLFAT